MNQTKCLLFILFAFCTPATENGKREMSTFDLKTDVTSKPVPNSEYIDITSYIYTTSKPVYKNKGKILAVTVPDQGQVLTPKTRNGFIDAILRAYNEHRHLVLRPDDVWLAITTALGLYVNAHSEEMRHTFVEHEGKITLSVTEFGTLYSVDWDQLIKQMSQHIADNTKDDIRSWIEPNFSTTTKTTKTVGRVVLMGVMQNYFKYKFYLLCGIPKVTLQGTLSDWKELRRKASYIKNFNIPDLTQWADLMDPILEQFVDSYSGNVDLDFWSRIWQKEPWGSGRRNRPMFIRGWITVFVPFSAKGHSNLRSANPDSYKWGEVDLDLVPPSTTAVPVYINDNGREYDTIFYGGHIVSLYNEQDDTVRPSLDWAIVDITGSNKTQDKDNAEKDTNSQDTYKWREFLEPSKVRYSVLSYVDNGEINGDKGLQQIKSKGVVSAHALTVHTILCAVFLRYVF